MWIIGTNKGVFEGDTLKGIINDMAQYYSDNDEYYGNVKYIINDRSDKEFSNLIRLFESKLEKAIEAYSEDFQSECAYRSQVNSYYNSTRGV